MTQQVSHSFLVYILRVIRALLSSTGSPGVLLYLCVCVESQLSNLLPAEPLSHVVSQTLLLSSVEFLSREWSVESDSVESGEQRVIVQRSAREQTRQSLCIWYSTQM